MNDDSRGQVAPARGRSPIWPVAWCLLPWVLLWPWVLAVWVVTDLIPGASWATGGQVPAWAWAPLMLPAVLTAWRGLTWLVAGRRLAGAFVLVSGVLLIGATWVCGIGAAIA